MLISDEGASRAIRRSGLSIGNSEKVAGLPGVRAAAGRSMLINERSQSQHGGPTTVNPSAAPRSWLGSRPGP